MQAEEVVTAGSHSPTQLYMVGGEDYVARTWKRRFTELGIGVAGHAPKSWRPPFAPPKFTTHLLLIEDDCGDALRVAARRLSKEHGIPLIEAPARNRPTETMELLKKEGLIEPSSQIPEPATVAPEATAETPPLTTNLGEAMMAAATLSKAKEPQPKESNPKESRPKDVALRLLRESNGLFTDKIVARLVTSETGTPFGLDEAARVRKENKIRKAATGKRPQALVALLAKYGYADKPSRPRVNGVQPMSADPSDKLQTAIVAAIKHLEDRVLAPHQVSRLVLVYENGHWSDPEIERIAVQKGTIRLPKRGR